MAYVWTIRNNPYMVTSWKGHQVVWNKKVLGIRADYMDIIIWIKVADKIEQINKAT